MTPIASTIDLDIMTRSRDFWQRKFTSLCEENARLRAELAHLTPQAKAVLDADFYLVGTSDAAF